MGVLNYFPIMGVLNYLMGVLNYLPDYSLTNNP